MDDLQSGGNLVVLPRKGAERCQDGVVDVLEEQDPVEGVNHLGRGPHVLPILMYFNQIARLGARLLRFELLAFYSRPQLVHWGLRVFLVRRGMLLRVLR